ncbi:hypothetical protein KGMB01110_12810 [Mediterraneibacter butyricigenes]|uniref:Uncharacterized protein n=1 Tax=Mediterraneibacter butyricigenes TaxID=2316025 RepID=A0A391P0C6_9FIRM|nr:hypothetical protein KGMB01110_12810 [Mediterraneibacter butyricigenes]
MHRGWDVENARRKSPASREFPVLSESERERRLKGISLWGGGKRKRFPLQPFAGG